MHFSRILVIVGFVVLLAGCFLPWASIGDLLSVSGMDGSDGPIAIALMALALVISVTGDRSGGLGAGRAVGVLIFAVLAALIGVINLTKIESGISTGIGLYLTILGGGLGAVGGITGFKK